MRIFFLLSTIFSIIVNIFIQNNVGTYGIDAWTMFLLSNKIYSIREFF